MIRSIKELVEYRQVINQLVKQFLVLRYRRTLFGYLWTLINPLMMISIMSIVFSALLNQNIADFSIFLFAGMIPWTFFSSTVSQSSGAILQNEAIIKKIYIPKIIFPVSIIIGNLIDNLLMLLIFVLFVSVVGGSVVEGLVYLIPSYLILAVFTSGVSLIVATVSVYFRDVQHLIGILLQGVFFLSPIIYPKSRIEGLAGDIVDINPMTGIVEIFREPLMSGSISNMEIYSAPAYVAGITFVAGALVFRYFEDKLVYRL